MGERKIEGRKGLNHHPMTQSLDHPMLNDSAVRASRTDRS